MLRYYIHIYKPVIIIRELKSTMCNYQMYIMITTRRNLVKTISACRVVERVMKHFHSANNR